MKENVTKYVYILYPREDLAIELGQLITNDLEGWKVLVFKNREHLLRALEYVNNLNEALLPDWIFSSDAGLLLSLQQRKFSRLPQVVYLREEEGEEGATELANFRCVRLPLEREELRSIVLSPCG